MNEVKKVFYYALRTLETFFFVFIAALAIVNMTMLVQYKILNRPVPTFMGFSYVKILSGSMEPTLDTGDVAICKAQDEYSVGDAVLFEEGTHLVLHRIVDIADDGSFITKGDANNVKDENTVMPEDVHGTLFYRIRGFGDTLTFATSWMGAFWLVLAALFIFLAMDMGIDLLKESISNGSAKGTELPADGVEIEDEESAAEQEQDQTTDDKHESEGEPS